MRWIRWEPTPTPWTPSNRQCLRTRPDSPVFLTAAWNPLPAQSIPVAILTARDAPAVWPDRQPWPQWPWCVRSDVPESSANIRGFPFRTCPPVRRRRPARHPVRHPFRLAILPPTVLTSVTGSLAIITVAKGDFFHSIHSMQSFITD